MSRKFFDMNSGDTFNRWDYHWDLTEWAREKKIEWPPWLTAPVHYQRKEIRHDYQRDATPRTD